MTQDNFTKCANFMNQEAIDRRLDALNKSMMERDREDGHEIPEPLYRLGSNCCIECDYGLGMETSSIVLSLKKMAGVRRIKRACYEPVKTRRVFLKNEVRGDFPLGHTTVAEPGEYEAHVNPQGAVSVVASNGQMLGVKPGEFEWVTD